MSQVLYGSDRSPLLRIVDFSSGGVKPVPSWLDQTPGAFDGALGRQGWVAVRVGYKVGAIRDGELDEIVELPDAWEMRPGADSSSLLISRFTGRAREDGALLAVVLVDSAGTILQTVELPLFGLIGELSAGFVVGEDGLWSWNGEPIPIPWGGGTPIAVLDGRIVVLLDQSGHMSCFDYAAGTSRSCSLPPGLKAIDFLGGRYDSSGTRFVAKPAGPSEFVIADANESPRWVPIEVHQTPVWLEQDRLLLDRDEILDLQTDVRTVERIDLGSLLPRVDVTGRFWE